MTTTDPDDVPPRDEDELPPRDLPDHVRDLVAAGGVMEVQPLEAPPLEASTLRRVLQPFLAAPDQDIAPPAGELVVYHRAELLNETMLALAVPQSDEEAVRIGEYLEVSRQLQDAITAEWEDARRATYAAWKSVCSNIAKRAGLLASSGDKHARAIVGQYLAVKKQRAEQERLDNLELQRLQRERDARAQAAVHTAAGRPELAQQAVQFALEAPLVEPPPAVVTKVPGVVGRTYYDVTIDHPGQVPREYCSPDAKLLQAAANANKGKITIAGVTITERTSAARSGRR